MVCKNCGATLPDTAAFCSNCGMAFPKQPEPQPQQAYTPPPRQQPYTPPSQQTYAPQGQYQQPQGQYQQPEGQPPYGQPQPQYQQPQYQQYPPGQQYPQKKKSNAGLIALAAVLAVLLLVAVIWGVSLKKKIKPGSTETQAPRASASQRTTEAERTSEAEEATEAERATEAAETAAPTEAPAPTQSSSGKQEPVAPGEIFGKLEGYWNAASDPSAFVHFSVEQFGWAFSAGFYYSELDVYAHMDGELRVGQYGFYHAHFSEPASGGRPAADFDLWIDASVVDDGMISCMMCQGEPDFSRMTVLRFAGRTEEEALR